MGEVFQRQGNRRRQRWIQLGKQMWRNTLHYLRPHGKPVKSNSGKNLTAINGNLICVQSEPKSFTVEPSPSLVHNSKNNFSW